MRGWLPDQLEREGVLDDVGRATGSLMTFELPREWLLDDRFLVAGVDIGGTQCSVNLGEVSGGGFRLVSRQQFATEVDRGPEATLMEVEARLAALLRGFEPPAVIGVSCGGPLDAARGVIQSPPNLPGWDDIAIASRFEKTFGAPCALGNDANASACAEWAFGAGRGCRDLVFLTFGTGLGAGMILNGATYEGSGGLAGEVGHWRIGRDVGPARYGKRGSFEAFCSGNGIVEWYRELSGGDTVPDGLSAMAVAGRARHGDPVATKVFAQAADRLGRGVALLVDALAPQVVVIGGIYVYANDLLRNGAERALLAEAHPRLVARCRVVPAELGAQLGSYASCCVALRSIVDRRRDARDGRQSVPVAG
jgi:glucokinase